MEVLRSEREELIRKIFLNIFREEDVADEQLEQAICETYRMQGIDCNTVYDIPMKDKEEAIRLCCESVGLNFENFDDILNYFRERI